MKSLLVQSGVTLGVWSCLIVDVMGNYAGQGRGPCWVPIIQGCWLSTAFVVGVLGTRIGTALRHRPTVRASS